MYSNLFMLSLLLVFLDFMEKDVAKINVKEIFNLCLLLLIL